MEVSLIPFDRALRLDPDANGRWPCVALVGAGGKTTALFQLARLLLSRAEGVVVTTTTHLGMSQAQHADQFFHVHSEAELSASLPLIKQNKVILFTGPPDPVTNHLSGLSEPLISRLWEAAQARRLPLLVEADGARCKPLKAPAAYEPVIPEFANLVIVCAGLSGLGQPLEESTVHRAYIFADLTNQAIGSIITPQSLANLLSEPAGGLKNIKTHMRRVLLLNQADTPEVEAQARWIAERVLGDYDAVLAGVLARGGILQVWEPSAAIILAAGGAQRFGRPKQLLEIEGHPLVYRSARVAQAAGLDPIIVVCGAYTQRVKQALEGLPVVCVDNPDWEQGQSTSLVAGIRRLPETCTGAVFMLADQPFVSLDVLLALLQAHSRTLAPIVAPRVGDQRTNPVYFDRVTFPDLLQVTGDMGGRTVIQSGRFRVQWLDWLDEALLIDIDTPEDFERWSEEQS